MEGTACPESSRLRKLRPVGSQATDGVVRALQSRVHYGLAKRDGARRGYDKTSASDKMGSRLDLVGQGQWVGIVRFVRTVPAFVCQTSLLRGPGNGRVISQLATV